LNTLRSVRSAGGEIIEALKNDAPLPYYGRLFEKEIDDAGIPQYDEYESVEQFIESRISWRKEKLRVNRERRVGAQEPRVVSIAGAPAPSITGVIFLGGALLPSTPHSISSLGGEQVRLLALVYPRTRPISQSIDLSSR